MLTARVYCDIVDIPLKGLYFFALILRETGIRPERPQSGFPREAKETGGAEIESKNYPGLHGMQAAQLQYDEKQEKRPRQA